MDKGMVHKSKITYLVNDTEISRCLYLEMKETMRNFWGNMIMKYPKTVKALPAGFKMIEFRIVVDNIQKECIADDIFILMTRKNYENHK